MKLINLTRIDEDCDGPRLLATFAIDGFKLIKCSTGEFIVVAPPDISLAQHDRRVIRDAAVAAFEEIEPQD